MILENTLAFLNKIRLKSVRTFKFFQIENFDKKYFLNLEKTLLIFYIKSFISNIVIWKYTIERLNFFQKDFILNFYNSYF